MKRLIGENVMLMELRPDGKIFTRKGVLIDIQDKAVLFDDRRDGEIWIFNNFIFSLQNINKNKNPRTILD